MPIERQSEQWPHRREAMLRAAAIDIDWDAEFGRYPGPHGVRHTLQPQRIDRDYNNRLTVSKDGLTVHYPPDQINPPSNSDARPETIWQAAEPEQPTLDLPGVNKGLSFHEPGSINYRYTVPVDRKPIQLHRGIAIPLDWLHTSGPLRRHIFGPDLEDRYDDADPDAPDWARADHFTYLPGMPTNMEAAGSRKSLLDPRLADMVLENLDELGTHWTTSPKEAESWSVDNAIGAKNYLPAVVTTDWMGHGEDPYREDTYGDHDTEKEITLLKGAPLNITQLRVRHPETNKWHSFVTEPRQHQARKLAGPFNLHDTEYYKGRTMVPVHPGDYYQNPLGPIAGTRAYNFPPTGLNPPSGLKGRPRTFWEPAEPEQDTLPADFPTETTIDSGLTPVNPSYKEPYRLPYDRQPKTLYRGLTVDLASPAAAHIRRTLYGSEWENVFGHYGQEPLPGMPDTEELADHWSAYDYENPDLGPMLLDHLSNFYDHHNLGQHWSIYPNIGKEFGADGNGRMGLPLNVVLSAEWRGAGEDPYRRGTMGNWPHEGEITLLPDAPLHVTNVHIQHPQTKKWHNVLDTPSHRQASRRDSKSAWDDPAAPLHLDTPRWQRHNRPVLPPNQLDSEDWVEGEKRHFSPDEVNPATTSPARPRLHWRAGDDEQDALDLDLPATTQIGSDEAPLIREPQTLYRGVQVPLYHPELHDVWRMLRPERPLPEHLRDDTPRLPGLNTFQYDDTSLAQTHPAAFDNSEIGPRILDFLERRNIRGPGSYDDQEGLGSHWTTDRGLAIQFAGVSASHPKYLQAQLSLPVLLSAHWHGAGEDPYRSETYGHFPHEKEISLLPGAGLQVHGVHVLNPHTMTWHQVLDTPHHREAALFYDRGDYDPGDFFTSRGGTCTMCKRPRRLPPGPFCSHGEGEEEFRRRLELDSNTPFRTASYYDEDYDDEDDEHYEGYPQEVHPFSYNTPMFPDSMSRPLYRDPTLGRDVYHFSPHEINPASDGVSRPTLTWRRGNEPEHPTLDLDLPFGTGDYDGGGQHWSSERMNLPTDRHPVTLYRGVGLDLDHPDLHRLRRLLEGRSAEDENSEDYLPTAEDLSNKALVRGDRQPVEDNAEEIHQTILDHLNNRHQGLGTHWSTDRGQAEMFARYNSAATGKNRLPVVLQHQWMGAGEDPYRRDTEGEWTDEKEITKLRGAPINISRIDIHHGPESYPARWHTVYNGDTLRHQARIEREGSWT